MTKATKIVCTLGPACTEAEVLRDMVAAGMNVARINCSHGTHETHLERISMYRQVCHEMDLPAAVLLDTKGPEIRLGDFGEGEVMLIKGRHFVLYGDPNHPGDEEGVGITYSGLADLVGPGTRILIDDGKIRLDVESVDGGDIICQVRDSGPVSTRKGVNVPDVHLDMEFLSEKDRSDLLFAIEEDMDFVAASFVRRGEDIREIRDFLGENGGRDIQIISKIENPEGVDNFDEILELSDGIMIARGDMGVEVDFATLPGIQKRFIDKCNRVGKPVITATQMLESMVEEPTPTRAEITDVANAVFDGTSAVMLSGETASGNYPARAVEVMSRILTQAEEDLAGSPRAMAMELLHREDLEGVEVDLSTAIGHAACQMAIDIDAKAMIAITQSGYTARMMARFHPMRPIIAATPSEKVMRQMSVIRNVYPVMTGQSSELDSLLEDAMKGARQRGFVSCGDRVVISAGLPLSVAGNTNMIRVETIK